MSIPLESKIEGLLFYKGDEVEIKELSNLFEVNEDEVKEALIKLEENLTNRGIVLVRKNDSVVLGINSDLGLLIESIRKEELNKELSKASLDTLSIILYQNGVSRSEIDYIRGVNSSFILRNLLVRGLIEKMVDPKDTRKILYHPTFDTLSYLGITKIEQLPNYIEVVAKLKETLNTKENDD